MAFNNNSGTDSNLTVFPYISAGISPIGLCRTIGATRFLQDYVHGRGEIDDWQVKHFFQRLPDSAAQPYGGRAAFLKTDNLQEVWFHLTNRCNQACRHCLFSSSSRETTELSGSRIREIAAQAASWVAGSSP